MPLLIPLALLALIALMVLILPVSVIQRYRAGTARRPARAWLAVINVCAIGLSAAIFLTTAALTSLWVPHALLYSAAGLGGGCALGALGLGLAHWERIPGALHYTPNRWLVLAITGAVAARLGFGLWRAWNAWETSGPDESWLAASGFAGSMAAGALVIGYYLSFWTGVWIAARKHRRRGAGAGR
ncbi:hypothetical protein BH23VER1_BH23VER1_01110 [soil metagenome]